MPTVILITVTAVIVLGLVTAVLLQHRRRADRRLDTTATDTALASHPHHNDLNNWP